MPAADSQGNHRTKDLPLKGDDLRILLPFLAQHKVGSRLLLAGVRRNGQRLVFTTAHTVATKSNVGQPMEHQQVNAVITRESAGHATFGSRMRRGCPAE
jgi:hypothetical protein